MGQKAEVSWRRETEEGEKLQVYAQHIGDQWIFFHRGKRYDNWQKVEKVPLEDWLELLDAIERRIARRLVRPEESKRIRKTITEKFPGTKLPEPLH